MFSELENLISNEAERFLRKVLGLSKFKCCWQVQTTSILLVLKRFIKKRLTTKSRDNKSDFTSRHASKPYINEGKHLLDNNYNTTSSFATLLTLQKIAFAER